MRLVPRPDICWFETVAGRPYPARNLTRGNRAVFWSPQDTPCKDHCPLDTPDAPDV